MTTTPSPTSTPRIFSILWGLFLDAGLATGVFFALRLAGFAPYYALLGGAIVAGLRFVYGILRERRVEGFAAFMCVGFVIGMALAFVTGSDRFLLLKDSFTTAAMGLLFLATCFVGRPFIFYASKRFNAAGATEEAEWERKWNELPGFRTLFRKLTGVWAVAFIAEALIRIPVVYLLPIDLAALVAGLMMPIMITALLIGTIRVARRAQARAAQNTVTTTQEPVTPGPWMSKSEPGQWS